MGFFYEFDYLNDNMSYVIYILTINNIDRTDLLKNVLFFKLMILLSYFIKHNITV